MIFNRRILVPNAVTAANMVLGFIAIVLASKLMIREALFVLFAAALCDMLDGRLARMLNATSDFGVQFDSFSDVISFGVAPAFIVYQASLRDVSWVGAAVGSFYMLCGVFRLARFNLEAAKPGEKNYFQGLPIPYGAGHIGAFVLMREQLGPWVTAGLVVLVGAAMASRVRLPNFKTKSSPQWMLFLMIANSAAVCIYPSWPTFIWWLTYNAIMLAVNWVAVRAADKAQRASEAAAGGAAGTAAGTAAARATTP